MTLDKARELCDELIGSTGHQYEVARTEQTTAKGATRLPDDHAYYVKRVR
jgi:hypothetical protein